MAPWVALLIVVVWIGSQRHSIRVMEMESALLLKHIATLRSAMPTSDILSRITAAQGDPAAPELIDWRKLSDHARESQQGGIGSLRAMTRLQQRLKSMSRDHFTAALDEIAALNLPSESRVALESLLLESVVEKDPQLALYRFIRRLDEDQGALGWHLAEAFKAWASRAPQKAATWFEQQIANGVFDAKALGGKNEHRIRFEAAMMGALLDFDAKAAASRFARIPADQRVEVMEMVTIKYHEASGNDDVLSGFLESHAVDAHRDEARVLAEKITDKTRREQVLENLE